MSIGSHRRGEVTCGCKEEEGEVGNGHVCSGPAYVLKTVSKIVLKAFVSPTRSHANKCKALAQKISSSLTQDGKAQLNSRNRHAFQA